MNDASSYDLRECPLSVVDALCASHHGYGGASATATYSFAVYEDGRAVAAYAWQPPPPGAAKSVCPEAPPACLRSLAWWPWIAGETPQPRV